MELLMRDTRALRDERRIDREMARKFWCATALTQRPFPTVSELQVRVDGVGATPRHRGAVDVAVRESTGLTRAPRQFRDGVRSAQATGYVLGFLSLLIMVPAALCWNLGVLVYEALRREKPPPVKKKIGKVAPAQDWRYELKDGFPQRKNAALFDLTHKAKADPRARFKTFSAGDLIRSRPAAAQPSYSVPVRRTEQDDLLESFAAERAKQRRAGPPPG